MVNEQRFSIGLSYKHTHTQIGDWFLDVLESHMFPFVQTLQKNRFLYRVLVGGSEGDNCPSRGPTHTAKGPVS